MGGNLTEKDKQRFEEMRAALNGVERADRDPPERSVEPGPVAPMLAKTLDRSLASLSEDKWVAEPKFDGTRIILQHVDGEITSYTRRAIERSDLMPDLVADANDSVPDGTILDGEYAYVTDDGGTDFIPIHTAGDRIAERGLTPVYFVFDMLSIENESLLHLPLTERKERLRDTIGETAHIQFSPVYTHSFEDRFDERAKAGEEGLMVKRRSSRYYPGVRSSLWRKVKAFSTVKLLAVGYTEGAGSRKDTFGALVMSDGEQYRGRVGSGFTRAMREHLMETCVEREDPPFLRSTVGKPYTPIEPIVISVRYQEITGHGDLRAPVFVDVHPDKRPEHVSPLDG